ncbi:MAG: PleD family two-component system response regulator [Rhodospirillales bacterium]|nr:PleD family two-component system response regulator [Rhodospirillales bacterium]
MTARILIVDDVPANMRLLDAKLSAEYYQVATARNGAEALDIARSWQPDLILLDVMMPGMDGYECCRKLKAEAETLHIPVVMVTALGDTSERLRGLEAGADDFLTKPVEYDTLMARVRSLVRLKRVLDEWRARGETARTLGLSLDKQLTPSIAGARALLIDDWDLGAEVVTAALLQDGVSSIRAKSAADMRAALAQAPVDLVVVSLSLLADDPLKLIAALRAGDGTHDVPLLIMADPVERERILRGFALGASDWLTLPVDPNELRARARNQLRRKLYQDRLRADLGTALEMALTDPLTGLYNQRYLRRHLNGLLEGGAARELSLLMLDVDHFKSVNDECGHATGDRALRLIAETLRDNMRMSDSIARYGGEEFVVLMPAAGPTDALIVAEQLRRSVQDLAFFTGKGDRRPLTISIGIACTHGQPTKPDALLRAADQALYAAKRNGRNQVVMGAAPDAM